MATEYPFSTFRFSPPTGELRRGGKFVPIEPKAFEGSDELVDLTPSFDATEQLLTLVTR